MGHTLVVLGLKRKSLHGTIAAGVKGDFKVCAGSFQFWSSWVQSLRFECVPGRAAATDRASPGAMLSTIPERN